MALAEVAARLLDTLAPETVLIGGVCGALYGVERFTRDVDLAATFDASDIMKRLQDAGILAEIRRSSESDELSWVVHGELDGIEFQVLPASETGISIDSSEVKAGLRVADIQSFITSKCIAGGQQDMHDVAALWLMHPELTAFCREKATAHGCLEKLQGWLDDRRLQQRYSAQSG